MRMPTDHRENILDLMQKQNTEGLLQYLTNNSIKVILCSDYKTIGGGWKEICIGDVGARKIAEVLTRDTNLTHVDLSRNNIGDVGAKAIARALLKNNVLTHIALRNNQIGEAGAKAIANSLAKNNSLTHVELGDNRIGDAGVKEIAKALAMHTSSTRMIDLRGNHMGVAGAKEIAEVLAKYNILTHVAMGDSQIGVAGAKDIANALAMNTSLTGIELSNSGIGVAGAKEIAKALAKNASLTRIYLGNNRIGDAGAKAVANVLTKNTSLTHIELGHNQIGDAGTKAIANSLTKNNSLTQIDLWNNEVGVVGAKNIVDALVKNNSVTQLNLAGNGIGIAALEARNDALQINKLLKDISGGKDITMQLADLKFPIFAHKFKVIIDNLDHIKAQYMNNPKILQNILLIIAGLYNKHNALHDALKFYKAEWHLVEKIYGCDDDSVVLSLGNMFSILTKIGDGTDIAQMLRVVAESYRRLGDYNKSTDCYTYAIDIFKKHNKKQELIKTLENLGKVHEISNNLEKAVECYQKVIEVQRNSAHCSNKKVVNTLDKIKNIYMELGLTEIVNNLTVEILQLKQKTDLGSNVTPNLINAVSHHNKIDDIQTDADLNSEKIKTISRLMKESSNVLTDQEEKGILLLGKTGAGKSTLANMMCGKDLEVIYHERLGKLVIATNASNDKDIFKIAQEDKSETTLPNKARIGDVVLWDCPGFHDSAGIVQEIANAFYIKMLFENTKYIKCVLVVSESYVTQNRGIDFIDTVEHLVKIFNNVEQFQDSLSLVITHTPSFKQVVHIENFIANLLEHRSDISVEIKNVIKYLSKSIQLFYAPTKEGQKLPQYDFLHDINKSTEYLVSNSKLANVAVSETSLPYAKGLMNTSLHNLQEILGAVVESMSELYMYIENGNEGKLAIQYSELVKPWMPNALETLDYNRLPIHSKEREYFLELQELSKLQAVLNTHDNTQPSVSTMLDLLEVMEEFVIDRFDTKRILQHYSYVIKQQIEHVKFFASVCFPSVNSDFCQEAINICKKVVSERFALILKNMDLGEYNNMSYYDEAIKYLNMYGQYLECQKSKAKALYYMGNICYDNGSVKNAMNNYASAIKCDKHLKDVYYKVGQILFDQGEYEKAIKFFSIISNNSRITDCYNELLGQNPDDALLRIKLGEYYESVGLYEKAKDNYLMAFDLTDDGGIHQYTLTKMSNVLSNSSTLSIKYLNRAQNKEFYDFKDVNPHELCNLMGTDTDIDYVL